MTKKNRLRSKPYGSSLSGGLNVSESKGPLERRAFLLGFLGSLAVAPAIITATASADAAPLPEADPETIKAD